MIRRATLSPNQVLTVVREEHEVLELVSHWLAGTVHKTLLHFHPEQEEQFEVLEGTLEVKLDGETLALGAGDTFDVPAGAVHRCRPLTEARASWEVRPPLRTLGLFEALAEMSAHGRLQQGRRGARGVRHGVPPGHVVTEPRVVRRQSLVWATLATGAIATLVLVAIGVVALESSPPLAVAAFLLAAAAVLATVRGSRVGAVLGDDRVECEVPGAPRRCAGTRSSAVRRVRSNGCA